MKKSLSHVEKELTRNLRSLQRAKVHVARRKAERKAERKVERKAARKAERKAERRAERKAADVQLSIRDSHTTGSRPERDSRFGERVPSLRLRLLEAAALNVPFSSLQGGESPRPAGRRIPSSLQGGESLRPCREENPFAPAEMRFSVSNQFLHGSSLRYGVSRFAALSEIFGAGVAFEGGKG